MKGDAQFFGGQLRQCRNHGKQHALVAAGMSIEKDPDVVGGQLQQQQQGGGWPRWGGLPLGGEIRKEGQSKEEGLESAKEVCCTAVQVDNSNAVFLLMAEARVAPTTALSSTVASGALLLLGGGATMIIPGCRHRDNTLDNNNDNELAQDLVGTQQQEQRHGTHRQRRQLLVWAFTTLTYRLKHVIGHGLMLSLSIAKWRDLLNSQSLVYDGDRQAPPDLLNLLPEGTDLDPDKELTYHKSIPAFPHRKASASLSRRSFGSKRYFWRNS
jgi:hypothetical protein